MMRKENSQNLAKYIVDGTVLKKNVLMFKISSEVKMKPTSL